MGLHRNRKVWEVKSCRNQQGWQNFEVRNPCEICENLQGLQKFATLVKNGHQPAKNCFPQQNKTYKMKHLNYEYEHRK